MVTELLDLAQGLRLYPYRRAHNGRISVGLDLPPILLGHAEAREFVEGYGSALAAAPSTGSDTACCSLYDLRQFLVSSRAQEAMPHLVERINPLLNQWRDAGGDEVSVVGVVAPAATILRTFEVRGTVVEIWLCRGFDVLTICAKYQGGGNVNGFTFSIDNPHRITIADAIGTRAVQTLAVFAEDAVLRDLWDEFDPAALVQPH